MDATGAGRVRWCGLVLAAALLCGCSEPGSGVTQGDAAQRPPLPTGVGPGSTPLTGPPGARTITSIWARSCALCHADGTGGAPRFADAEAWAPRLAQGEDVLLAHTLEGYRNMPPLGYCMDCSAEDFIALIRFMTPQGTR